MTYRAWTLKQFDRAALKDLTAAIAEQNTEELEMNAMDDEPWSEQKYAATLAAQQKEVGLLAGILAARGITDPTEALTLLAGEEELSDPMLLTDMDKACARILEAIDKEQTIVVYGDYDVDGVTATALLYQGQATALQGQKSSIYIGSVVNTNLFGNAELREQMLTLQMRNNGRCTIALCIFANQIF